MNVLTDLPHKERVKSLKYFYTKNIIPSLRKKPCMKMEDEQLHEILNIFYEVVFYTQSINATKEHYQCFKEAEKRNIIDRKEVSNILGSLINVRQLNKAREIYTYYTQFDFPILPYIKESKQDKSIKRHVFSIDSDNKNTLIKTDFSYSKSLEIIVISHPRCHFTQYVAEELAKDDKLNTFLKEHSTWIEPVTQKLDYNELLLWKNKYPQFEIKIVDKTSTFTNIDYWGTPTFYFMENGVVKDKLIGWPKEGRKIELIKLIKKHFPNFDSLNHL